MIEHLPDQIVSFRERKPYRNIHKEASIRSDIPYIRNGEITPTKSLLRGDAESYNDYNYSNPSSGKKTVRFAETSEGLLRAVPVDPTFNDSDFIYDMQINI